MFYLPLSKHFTDIQAISVLEFAGYKQHMRNGWVRQIDKRKRFHAVFLKGEISIHVDVTINGHHNVGKKAKNFRREEDEKARLIFIKERMFPPKRRSHRSRGVVAQNVAQLQKDITEINKHHKRSCVPFFKSICNQFRNIFQ